MNSLKSGSPILDGATMGGLSEGNIVHIYGPSGAGKTTLALQYAISAAKQGFQVIYVDAGGGFSLIRLRQLTGDEFDFIAQRIAVVSLTSFKEQDKFVSQLDKICTPKVRLLIFDTIVSLYRQELGEFSDNIMLNRLLNRQLGAVASLTKERQLVVILINQVRGDFENSNGFQPVAASIISFWCTTIIRIKNAESMGYRDFKLIRVKSAASKEFVLKLGHSGFE